MKYITTKKPQEIKLEGINIEVEKVNEDISSLKLTDSKGNILKLNRENYYGSIQVYIKAPPKLEKRWFVTGKIGEAEILPKEFDSSSRALDFLNQQDNHSLIIEEKDIEIQD